jgi:cellulose synthase/poly-beta-1,6-N-acetylglucosamine synthase-like glycosyltransferase
MQSAELVVLWSSLGLALYAFVVYPLAIALASRLARNEAAAPELDGTRLYSWPRVTLLIAARREESLIVDRLQNAAALNYPPDRLEILVGCDGEGDLTALLARSFEDSRVKVVQLSERRGMATVLAECVSKATGEIIVFTDVHTMMRPDAVRRLVRHFQQADVGAVCGKHLPIDPTTGRSLSGLFWKFENFIEGAEARLGALSRVNSGIYAVRRSLYPATPQYSAATPTANEESASRRRYRLVYDDTAIAVEETPPTFEAEYRAGKKQGLDFRRGLQQLSSHLNARSLLMFWVSWTHKQLRRVGPLFLLAAFVSNACLSNDPFYLHVLLVHESLYLAALVGLFFVTGDRWWKVLCVPARFFGKSVRLAHAGWESIPGQGCPVPEPARVPRLRTGDAGPKRIVR